MNIFLLNFLCILIVIFVLLSCWKINKVRNNELLQRKTFDDMIENTYCINLSTNKERFLLMNQMAKKADIRLTRFEAIDTRGDRFMLFKEMIEPNALNSIKEGIMTRKRLRDSDLTPGAVGCYFSHMSLYREALSKGEKMILVFEDDVLIPTNFKKLLYQKMLEMPDGWDMFVLGWYEIFNKKGQNLLRNRRVSKDKVRLHNFILMHAYVITDVGMRKMLSYGTVPIRKQIDHMASDNSDKINIYGVYPNTWIKQGNPKDDKAYKTSIQIPLYTAKTAIKNV